MLRKPINLLIFAKKKNMKKLYPLLILIYLLFCLDSCEKKTGFELRGELSDLPSDTIWVVFDDPETKLDTIFPENGTFTYSFAPDTLQLFRLLDKQGNYLPVFADRGWQVTVKGSLGQPQVKGEGPNRELQEFRNQIASLQDDSVGVVRKAEEFIRQHTASFASAYLIDRYFVQVPEPDIEKVRELISPLRGDIKDCRVLSTVLQTISQRKSDNNSDFISYFSCKDRNGKYVSWTSSKEKYTLINFWASWDKTSLVQRDSLMTLCNRLPKEKFRVVNLSLDYEKKAWLGACKKDTESWIEVCDYTGWENSLIKQQRIAKIPASILIDRSRKILGTNLYGQELSDKVLQLIAEEKNKK